MKVKACGLFVSLPHPFIAASSDGVTADDILVEVKCPHVARFRKITPASIPYLCVDGGKLTLDQKHDYYYQIQGQLFVTDKQLCYLLVYTLVEQKINNDFIDKMITKLQYFFDTYFKHALKDK